MANSATIRTILEQLIALSQNLKTKIYTLKEEAIVLGNEKIALAVNKVDLTQQLTIALSNDSADQVAIATARNAEFAAVAEANTINQQKLSLQAEFDAYKVQQQAQDDALQQQLEVALAALANTQEPFPVAE